MDEVEMPSSPVAGERSLGRLLGLSDGVFAIAMTLLVLNLEIPPDTDAADVGQALWDLAPEAGAYALSFAVIGLFWLAHHRLFNVIVEIDHPLIMTNLVFLGFIALIPFPTEVFGTFGNEPASIAYASVMSLAGFAGTLLWVRALRAGLTDPRVHRDYLVHGIWRGVVIGGTFLLSLPLVVLSPDTAGLSWLLIFVGEAILARRFGSIHRLPKHPG
ncbi:MAG: TMEM175 family protein [Acidimicrobiales bacterium]